MGWRTTELEGSKCGVIWRNEYLGEGVVLCFFYFFFFKQKTAYEIGTGDWSSDVCLPISEARTLSGFDCSALIAIPINKTEFFSKYHHFDLCFS